MQMITLSALGLLITGVANHIYGLSSMTPARHTWMAAHNVLGLLFVIFSVWHVVLNRRMLWNHLRNTSIVGREMLLVGIIVMLAALFVSHAFLLGE